MMHLLSPYYATNCGTREVGAGYFFKKRRARRVGAVLRLLNLSSY